MTISSLSHLRAFLLSYFLVALNTQTIFVRSLSNEFPQLENTIENLRLSSLAYKISSCDDVEKIPVDITCHSYEAKQDGTQVAVLSSEDREYVAVSFAGTDNFEDVVADGKVKMEPFGPSELPINPEVYVHEGFNRQTFGEGLFDRIYETVNKVLELNPHYKIITTGHSLGAANSILAAVALALNLPEAHIENINFASPRIGDGEFRNWANREFENLSIWRFVYNNDLVARVPFFKNSIGSNSSPHWHHSGHTIQLGLSHADAFYCHEGDAELGYAGVSVSWQAIPFRHPKRSARDHDLHNYIHYIKDLSSSDPDVFYVDSFVTSAAAANDLMDNIDDAAGITVPTTRLQ